MKIHCLTHVPFEDAANIAGWADLRGYDLNYTHLHRYESLPPLESFDVLVIMGGSMNIYEHKAYPWLAQEKKFIRRAIDADKKIIGICLGAQLIADVLGAPVTCNTHKEIGWHKIKLSSGAKNSAAFSSLPEEMVVFQWHGDTFSTPPNAIHLASSTVCGNQAFQYGSHVLALQFHLEYSLQSIEKMLLHCADEIVDSPYIHTPEQIRAGYNNIPQTSAWLYTLLDNHCADN